MWQPCLTLFARNPSIGASNTFAADMPQSVTLGFSPDPGISFPNHNSSAPLDDMTSALTANDSTAAARIVPHSVLIFPHRPFVVNELTDPIFQTLVSPFSIRSTSEETPTRSGDEPNISCALQVVGRFIRFSPSEAACTIT